MVHANPFRVKIIDGLRLGAVWLRRGIQPQRNQSKSLQRRVSLGVVGAALMCVLVIWVRPRLSPLLWLDDIPVTGLPDKAVATAISGWWQQFRNRSMVVVVADSPLETKVTDLGCELNLQATTRRVLLAKHAHFWRPAVTPRPGEIDAVVACSDVTLNQVIDAWQKQAIPRPPKFATLGWEKGVIASHAGEAGDVIDRQSVKHRLEQDFVQLVRSGLQAMVTRVEPRPDAAQLEVFTQRATQIVKSPVLVESAQPPLKAHLLRSDLGHLIQLRPDANGEFELAFDAEMLGQLLRTRHIAAQWPAKNASLSVAHGDKFVVVPEVRGYRFSVPKLAEKLMRSIQQGLTRVPIDVELGEEAKLKAADVEQLGIRELMGTFTTHHACCQPRVNNIHRIADLLDGVIVLPGATFSVNEFVGPRTLANGFVMAPSIEDGEMVDTIGGGVSQFATTFYNALLRSGLEILERRAHTYWFSRYPMGHEATLSLPKPDLVFRNDTHAGVLIKTEYTEKSITVRVYGDKENRKIAFGVSGMTEIEQPPIERLPNPDLAPDKEHTKSGGRMGWSVMTWRTVTLANGEQKKDERKVTYKPQVRRIEVHPCKLRPDEPGYTAERCPKVDTASEEPEPAEQ